MSLLSQEKRRRWFAFLSFALVLVMMRTVAWSVGIELPNADALTLSRNAASIYGLLRKAGEDGVLRFAPFLVISLLPVCLIAGPSVVGTAVFDRAYQLSTLGKHLKREHRGREADVAYRAKREVLRHGILALYFSFRIAFDNVSMFSVRQGRHSLHLVRTSTDPYPRYEAAFIRAKVGTAKIISNTITKAPIHAADFLEVLDELDRLREFPVSLIGQRIDNALKAWQRGSVGEARYEARLALRALKSLTHREEQRVPSPQQRKRLKDALDAARSQCDAKFLSLPALCEVFDSIDRDTPYISRRIEQSLKQLQQASRLARSSKRFDAAKQKLDQIEENLLGGKPDGGECGCDCPRPKSSPPGQVKAETKPGAPRNPAPRVTRGIASRLA